MMAGTDIQATHLPASRGSTGALLRTFVIGLTAFLTVVDLFATQAILPSLAKPYGVSPAAIGFAVNASTIGMALAGLAGAVLVYFTLGRTRPMAAVEATARSPLSIWAEHLRNAPLRASFAIGFLILFAFIGTFTYVNFVLVREPLALSRMAVGFVYFVFLPSILTTPLAGRAVDRFGTRPTFWGALAF